MTPWTNLRRYVVYNLMTWGFLILLWTSIVIAERLGFQPWWARNGVCGSFIAGPFMFVFAAWLAFRGQAPAAAVFTYSFGSGLLGILETAAGILITLGIKLALGGGLD